MSTDPEAKLFYGYLQPEDDRQAHNDAVEEMSYSDEGYDDKKAETPWTATHTKKAHQCVGGMYGYSGNLGFFLAAEKSLHESMWDKVTVLSPEELTIKPEWNEQLQQAAKTFKLDISQLKPSWHLVCLYF